MTYTEALEYFHSFLKFGSRPGLERVKLLAKKLGELGNHAASEQVLAAVSEFEKGNLRLSAVLASLK